MAAEDQLTLQEIKASAAHHVHSVGLDLQATLYPMTAENYRASIFLDNRIALPGDAPSAQIDFTALCGQFSAVAEAETRYLFHISHVGSTLLSRLLGCKREVLSLREPLLLRWLSFFKSELGKAESRINALTYEAFLETSLGLISRPLGEIDQVIVKATSFTNNIAQDILTTQPKARAIGIYSRLDAFVATILKGGGGWNDILELSPIRLKRLHNMIGREAWQLSRLSPGEIAAMSWLCEMATLSRTAAQVGDRFMWLDFDAYLAQPDLNFARMCESLCLHWTDEDCAASERSGLRGQYSKDSRVRYGSETRQAQISAILMHQSAEVARARAWVDNAIAAYPEFGVLTVLR